MILLTKMEEKMKLAMEIKRDFKDNIEAVEMAKVILAEISILKNKLLLAKKEKKTDLTVQEEYKIVKKEIDETIDAKTKFEEGNRQDLVKESDMKLYHLNGYVEILEPLMPKQLSDDELKEKIEEILQSLHDETIVLTKKDMGKIMKALKSRLNGQTDMKKVNAILSKMLA